MVGLVQKTSKNVLITGGSGFIGANLAACLLGTTDASVTVLDNLSGPGSEMNLAWLKGQAGQGRLRFVQGDVRDRARVREAVQNVDEIFHLASTCGAGPSDHDIHAAGTKNVLECASSSKRHPSVLYLSTCKVYESLDRLPLQQQGMRYTVADPNFKGISESAPVDLSSPFACSRGLAEKVIQEYARLRKVPTIVLRVDTVAGPRQFADPKHGWVAHFVDRALSGRPITIFGNGYQVRDVLHVADLVEAMKTAQAYIGVTAGKVYNVGGGYSHSVSIREMAGLIERVCHCRTAIHYQPEQTGDFPFYVSDSWKFLVDTGWMARRTLEQTVRDVAAFWHAKHGTLEEDRKQTNEMPHAAAA